MACITPPPTTLVVDAFAHEDSADELSIPAESISSFRRPYIVVLSPVEEEQSKIEAARGGEVEVEDEGPSQKAASLMKFQRPEYASASVNRVNRQSEHSVTAQVLPQRIAHKRMQNQFFWSR